MKPEIEALTAMGCVTMVIVSVIAMSGCIAMSAMDRGRDFERQLRERTIEQSLDSVSHCFEQSERQHGKGKADYWGCVEY